jgi:hypothetical protein
LKGAGSGAAKKGRGAAENAITAAMIASIFFILSVRYY